MVRSFGKLSFVQWKLYLREPMAVFFTVLFGPLILILLGLIFGNQPEPMFGGRGYLDISVGAYAAVVIGISGLTTVPITLATRREMGVLRRFAATPLRPLTYVAADVLAPFTMTLLGVMLLFLAGTLIFQVQFQGNWLNLLLGVMLSTLAFFALGYAIGGLCGSSRIAIVVGNVLIIPMNMLSGALVPLAVMPDAMETVSLFIPLTHVVRLLRGLWFGQGWGDLLLEAGVLSGVLLLGVLVTALTFKWESA